MKKKIYFAGSIRGGRVDAALYRRIIEHIQQTDIVLTEHVGDLSLSAHECDPDNDIAIYNQDTAWLRESDVLIGEVTCPSLGVGYELAYAERYGVPCHLFYNSQRCQLSAMIRGNSYFNVYPYTKEEEIFEILARILNRND